MASRQRAASLSVIENRIPLGRSEDRGTVSVLIPRLCPVPRIPLRNRFTPYALGWDNFRILKVSHRGGGVLTGGNRGNRECPSFRTLLPPLPPVQISSLFSRQHGCRCGHRAQSDPDANSPSSIVRCFDFRGRPSFHGRVNNLEKSACLGGPDKLSGEYQSTIAITSPQDDPPQSGRSHKGPADSPLGIAPCKRATR
jgi:hypothetical protein